MASWLAPVEITIGELLIETSVPLLILIEILLVFLIMLSKRWMAFKFLHNKGIAFTLSTTSLLLLTEKKITLPAILVLILSPILRAAFLGREGGSGSSGNSGINQCEAMS